MIGGLLISGTVLFEQERCKSVCADRNLSPTVSLLDDLVVEHRHRSISFIAFGVISHNKELILQAMVTVKSPKTNRRRLAAHYLLLAFAGCFLCATIFIISQEVGSIVANEIDEDKYHSVKI